jgi:PAS domain S-box-containing protein
MGAPLPESQTQWFILTVVPYALGELRGFLVQQRDNTRCKQKSEALRESEAKFGAVFHDSLDVIIIGDGKSGKILNVNPVASHMLGYRPMDLIGKHFSVLFPPDNGHRHTAQTMLDQLEVYGTVFEAQKFRCADGTVVPMDLTVTMIPHRQGTAMVATLRDVTERTSIEEQRRRAHNELETRVAERTAELSRANALLQTEVARRKQIERMLRERTSDLKLANAELIRASQLKDEFLASMSHELRTPLNAILGLSEAIQEEVYGSLTDRQRTSLRSIEESGRHLLAMINDILDLAKIGAGKIELEFQNEALEPICQASLRLIRQSTIKKRITVSETFDASVTEIRGDERRIKQMLVNLLSNAIKFTPEGGHIGLEVVGDRERNAVHLTVWDTGIGIAPQDIPRLFQPFIQIDSKLSRHYGGTGLGLVMVARLAEMHGGRVTVESEPEKGSRFTVSLPWHTESVSTTRSASPAAFPSLPSLLAEDLLSTVGDDVGDETEQVALAPEPAPAPLIVLAEDNEDSITMMLAFLQSRGYRVVVARNGVEAVQYVREHRPALILMDIHMPEMDGLDATRLIRANSDLASIPIIALTALAMPGDREKCLEAGADDYMSKPVRLRELRRMIRALLKQGNEEGER